MHRLLLLVLPPTLVFSRPSVEEVEEIRGGQPGHSTTHARVFSMTQQDTQAAPDVVYGMIPLFVVLYKFR